MGWNSFPSFRLNICSFVLFKHVYHMAPGPPHSISSVPSRERIESSCCITRVEHTANCPFEVAERASRAMEDQCPLLSLLYVNTVLFQPGLDCIVLLDNSDTIVQGTEAFRFLLLITGDRCCLLNNNPTVIPKFMLICSLFQISISTSQY